MDVNFNSSMVSICVLVVSVLVVKVLNWAWFRPKKLEKLLRMQGIQGNSYRLLYGDFKDIWPCMKKEQPKTVDFSDDLPSHILPYYHNIIRQYGKASLVWFGPTPRVNITDPEIIKEILTNYRVFHKLPPAAFARISLKGVFFLEDEKWETQRKIVNTAFHLDKLKKMIPAMYLSCCNMLEKWESLFSTAQSKKLEIDVWPYLFYLTGDVVSRTLFGNSHAEGKRIFELQTEQIHLISQLIHFSFIPGWSYFPNKANKRMKVISGEIHSLVKGIINQREREMESGESIDENLLGTLIKSSKKTGSIVEDLNEECQLFYFAGTETTTDLLVWTLVMLSKYPEWQTRARQEVLKVFGNKQPAANFDGLSQLKTVTMILYEILRMYPPAPLILREPTKTVKLGNMTIPKGTQLTVLIGLMHHDPKIWGDDVNEFRPDRFSEGKSSAAQARFSFIPFLSGPRACVGQTFALTQAKLALSMMLQRFSFELSPSYRHAPFPIMTLQPQYGAPLVLHKL